MESTERDARSSIRARHAAARVAPEKGFLAGSIQRAAGERPPRARPQRRGSPGPIPNPAVKPAFAESTAARGCGRAGRRARGGRFSYARRERPAGGGSPCGPLCILRDADALRGGMCIAFEGRWLTLSVALFILGCPPPEGSRESFCGSRPRVEAVHAMRGARGMLKAGLRSLRGIPFVEPCCLRALLTVRFLSCRSFCVRFWFSGDVPTCGGRWDSIRFSHFVAEKD